VANGTYRATSDDAGEYSIADVTGIDLSSALWILAAIGDLGTAPASLPGTWSAGVDLVLLPLGSISGVIANFDAGLVGARVVAIPLSNAATGAWTEVDDRGEFVLERVPEGDHQVMVVGRRSGATHVIVVGGQQSAMRL
jgi:hypothetical protein